MAAMLNGFSQKKEEIVSRITQLERATDSLRFENKALKNSISILETELNLLKSSNALLENRLKFQEDINKSQTDMIAQMKMAADPYAIIDNPQNEHDSIISVVQRYFDASRWEDRLPLVYEPDQVRPLMQKAYADGISKSKVDRNTITVPGNNYKSGDKFIVHYKRKNGFNADRDATIYTRKTNGGFKIDWEATNQYNKESPRTYNARQGTDKIVVRISFYEFSVVDYPNYNITADKYFSIYGEEMLYFPRTSSVGKRIEELIKNSNGRDIKIMVEVQGEKRQYYNDFGEKEEKYFIFITRIVSEDWFGE
jgi:hypothetical protein